MQIKSFDFIAFATKDLNSAVKLFKSIGFQPAGQLFTDAGEITSLVQGNVHCALHEGIGQKAHARQFAERHGEGVCEIAFAVDNLENTIQHLTKRGAKLSDTRIAVTPRGRGQALSVTFGSIRHTFIQYREPLRSFSQNASDHSLKPLTAVDHLVLNVSMGEMDKTLRFYTDILSLQPAAELDLASDHASIRARAVKLPEGSFKILIHEPADDRSKSHEFVKQHNGSGVQAVVFATEDISATTRVFRENNLSFAEPPANSYDQLSAFGDQIPTLKRLDIFVEGNPKSCIMSAFTKPVIGNSFFGLVRRHNFEGFGKETLTRVFI
ncbi:MAG: VOC family protein [Deltaproteobacteria bacterium]|nr:VOC family protein [Deltaproteobacteria bacterium]